MQILLPSEYNSPKEIMELWKHFRQLVLNSIKNVPNDKFIEVPEPNRWSLSEVVEHLYITQKSLSRTFPIVMAKKFGIDFTGYEVEHNFKLIRRSLMKPTKVKNPPSVSPLNKYSYEELLPLLNESESKMIEFTNKWQKEDLLKRAMEHPIFGNLNLFDYLWVMTMHERSHLTALEERTK